MVGVPEMSARRGPDQAPVKMIGGHPDRHEVLFSSSVSAISAFLSGNAMGRNAERWGNYKGPRSDCWFDKESTIVREPISVLHC